MFCGKVCNEIINRVQRKALRAVYNDYSADFPTLLEKGNHFTIHNMNVRNLLIEVYKCLYNSNPLILSNIFTHKKLTYNLRKSNLLTLPKQNTITYGLNSLTYRGSITWNNLPDNLKECKNHIIFKEQLKNQKNITCSCHLCGG